MSILESVLFGVAGAWAMSVARERGAEKERERLEAEKPLVKEPVKVEQVPEDDRYLID